MPPARPPRPRHPAEAPRALARWRVAFAAAEAAFLLAFAAAEHFLGRRLVAGTWFARSALHYALFLIAAAAVAYAALRFILARAYRRALRRLPCPAGGAPGAAELMDDHDPRRLGRTALIVPAVMLPFAFFSGAAWVVGALLLVGILCGLEATTPPQPPAAQAIDAEALQRDAKLADLVHLAASRGLRRIAIIVPDDNAMEAACLPAEPRPTFVLSRPLVDAMPPAELKAAFAHELAHYELRHSRKTLLAEGLLRWLSAGGVCVVLAAGSAGGSAWRAVRLAPAALLTWYVLRVLLRPAATALLRGQERQAHRLGVEITGDPAAYVRMLRRLSAQCPPAGEPGPVERAFLTEAPSPEEAVGLVRRHAAERGLAADEDR
jgi:Zn-dependent protease with chaperone function